MIDPGKTCLYIPGNLKKFKLDLFNRIGGRITSFGGRVCHGRPEELAALPDEIMPIVGCSPELREMIKNWRDRKRNWIYWDRGYARRVFATWMPRGRDGGYYRWHLNSFQMQSIDETLPDDRWEALNTGITPWVKNPAGHIVVALPTPTYSSFHGLKDWTERTIRAIALTKTERQIIVRDKESHRSLQADLQGAYCLVAHASMAAVEAVMCGCPVIVHPDSAAALVGVTKLEDLERLQYPGRKHWLRSLAYSQFNEQELIDGTLWRMLK